MKKKTASFSTLLLLSFLMVSCGGKTSESSATEAPDTGVTDTGKPSESESSSQATDSYDPNWTPGPYALEGSYQPEVKNPKGEYNTLGQMRRSQGREGLPQFGEGNILVVPIQFADDFDNDMEFTDSDLESLENAFFGEGGKKSLPSVKDYYLQSSYGALHLDGVVSPVITLEKGFSDYMLTAMSLGADYAFSEMIDYVYDMLFEQTETYYLPDFDSDDDGKIDGLVLAYSWPAADYFYGSDLYDYISSLLVNDVFASKDFKGTAPVNSTLMTSGRISKMTGVASDSHVYIRGVGSLMGVDAYDDVKGNANTGTYRAPLAGLDIMDGNIQDHNPFTKYALGWVEPTIVTPSDVTEEGITIELAPSQENGDCLLISLDDGSLFGEYLLLDYYTPEGLNEVDSLYPYAYNTYGSDRLGLSTSGVRLYKVDSRLVEGRLGDYTLTDDEPNFEKTFVAKDGQSYSYQYDFAFSNDSVNEYASCGVYETYPLISLLSKKGFNRHLVDFTVPFTGEDLFVEGDSFGDKEGAYFYQSFAFDGDGDESETLPLTFEITSLSDEQASITIRRKNA